MRGSVDMCGMREKCVEVKKFLGFLSGKVYDGNNLRTSVVKAT